MRPSSIVTSLTLYLMTLFALAGCEPAPPDAEPNPSATESVVSRPTVTPEPKLVGVEVEPFAQGFAGPITAVVHLGGDQLFVAQNSGAIRIVEADGQIRPNDFLRIGERVGIAYDFGILGMTFDPNFEHNGHFYLNYVDPEQNSHIARFTADPTQEELVADPDSEVNILLLPQPGEQHNGGGLAFGPDGYLYVPMGDGIEDGDALNRAQDLSTLFGKVLRLDVSDTPTYTIPADNPFVDDPTARPEIWANGLRNPYSITIDEETGDIFLGDVGEKEWEEINRLPADTGGSNFGWSCREGSALFKSDCGQTGSFTPPIHEYPHEGECNAVVAGEVYRGDLYPELNGHLLAADFCNRRFWTLSQDGNRWVRTDLGQLELNPTLITTNTAGEIIVASRNELFKLTPIFE